jgi:protein SCO1/2
VARAQSGGVVAAALPVLLFCFHYDPATGRYTLAIMKLLRLAAAITVVVVGGTLFLSWRRDGGRA